MNAHVKFARNPEYEAWLDEQESKAGRGNHYRHQRRIVIGFDDETFEQIRSRAVKAHTSFAEEARTLIEWGLEADNG